VNDGFNDCDGADFNIYSYRLTVQFVNDVFKHCIRLIVMLT
jgi:hypothetical protein